MRWYNLENEKNKAIFRHISFRGLFDIEDTQRVLTVERLLKSIKDDIYEGFVSPLTIEEILKAPIEITEQLTNRIAEHGW